MKAKLLKYCVVIFSLLSAVLLNNCIDPYRPDLKDEDMQSILVVEGLITTEAGRFEVILRRSVPLDTMVNFTEESGAQVYILDSNGKRTELVEMAPGTYRSLNDDDQAEVGIEYQLFITDATGAAYESSPVTLEQSPDFGDLEWEETEVVVFVDNEAITQKAMNIYVNASDPTNETEYYQWEFSETFEVIMPGHITALDGFGMPYEATVIVPEEKKYCWVTRPQSNILVKSVASQSNSDVEKFVVLKIPENDDRLFYRYSIEVSQYRINEELYDFWKKLKDINETAGSLYDQVPAAVFGNISCCDGSSKVLGFFNAVDVKRKRIFIENYEHAVPAENAYGGCTYVTDFTSYHFVNQFYARSAFCSDCRVYGSNIKPDFW
ncbi:DUF4249 domain-containing protein [Draconibacterium sp. IB214405]|uniref:DUF4249 domain-containing protein n=1 Tax=Draconibacterium sp. IB214405 TaxID=3097352 RepID=UPI002A0E3B37|nr:DUF4249 domain-containing protein [Draconibacterium sp. IB214405]MDX8340830.1 DUF4249 domain-containing protein [Draconibacterium sp. IB214405]